MHIPQRFSHEILFHLISNYQRGALPGSALLLGVHGPAGEGKTAMTRRLLDEVGVETHLISGGQLESGTAGEPAEIVRTTYLHAGVSLTNRIPAAILLNDADAAIGSWGELTQYTVNTQNVVTELMHLSDYPNTVEGRPTPRVPIIITGNDFTRLYGPLSRPGRMNLFRWELTPPERETIVTAMLNHLPPSDVRTLATRFPDRPIAFWAAANAAAGKDRLLASIADIPPKDVLAHLVKGGTINPGAQPDPAELTHSVTQAAQRIVDNETISFLSEMRQIRMGETN